MILRGLFCLFALGWMLAWPAQAQIKLPEQPDAETIQHLVFQALSQGSGDFALSEYTHIQRLSVSETDKNGNRKKLLTTVKEAFVPSRIKKGSRVRWVYVLIEKDGKPVPAVELEKARLKAGERLLKAEEELQKQPLSAEENARKTQLPPPRGIYFSISSGGTFSSGTTFSVRSLMAFCNFRNPRLEYLNGRETVLLDFVPRSDAQWPSDERYKEQLVGRAWFDVADAMLAKLEGWPLGLPAPETPYVFYESLRMPDGQWLPRVIAMNTDHRKEFFKREFGDVVVEFTDYQRFGTETKDIKLNAPK